MNKNKQKTGSNLGNRRVLGCRSFLASATLIGAVLAVGPLAQVISAVDTQEIKTRSDKAFVRGGTRESTQFKNGNLKMSGNLYLPGGFDASRKYAAIVAAILILK